MLTSDGQLLGMTCACFYLPGTPTPNTLLRALIYCNNVLTSLSALAPGHHTPLVHFQPSSQSDPLKTVINHGIPLLRTLQLSPNHSE